MGTDLGGQLFRVRRDGVSALNGDNQKSAPLTAHFLSRLTLVPSIGVLYVPVHVVPIDFFIVQTDMLDVVNLRTGKFSIRDSCIHACHLHVLQDDFVITLFLA